MYPRETVMLLQGTRGRMFLEASSVWWEVGGNLVCVPWGQAGKMGLLCSREREPTSHTYSNKERPSRLGVQTEATKRMAKYHLQKCFK